MSTKNYRPAVMRTAQPPEPVDPKKWQQWAQSLNVGISSRHDWKDRIKKGNHG